MKYAKMFMCYDLKSTNCGIENKKLNFLAVKGSENLLKCFQIFKQVIMFFLNLPKSFLGLTEKVP